MSVPTREEVLAGFDAIVRDCYYDHALHDRRVRPLLDADAALRAEVERLKAALVAAAEHHLDEAKSRRGSAHYHAERARVLRSAAEGKP